MNESYRKQIETHRNIGKKGLQMSLEMPIEIQAKYADLFLRIPYALALNQMPVADRLQVKIIYQDLITAAGERWCSGKF